MQIVRMRGGREFMLTDKEALFVIKKISEKDVAVMPRLGNLVISDFDKEYLGPLDDDESLKYALYADTNGIIYCNDGQSWLFYHFTGNPFRKSDKANLPEPIESKDEINVEWEKEKDLKNRKWVKVPETHEVAVIPIEKYLEIKFTPQLKLLSQSDCLRSLPAIVGAEVILIGTVERLAREEKAEKERKERHKRVVANFKRYLPSEKSSNYDHLCLGMNFSEKEQMRRDYDEFHKEFEEMLPTQEEIDKEKELESLQDAQEF